MRKYSHITRVKFGFGSAALVIFAFSKIMHAENIPKKEYEFIDERIVEHTFLLDRKVTPITKYSHNPIIKSSNGACGVAKDKAGLIRLWYVGREPIAGEEPHGGKLLLGERTLRYAESTDGFNWKFPELGLVDFRGKKNHNILIKKESVDKNGAMLSHGERGFELPCIAVTDKTPSAKGKYTMFTRKLRGFAYSDDGLTWTAYKKNPYLYLGGSDTYNNFFYDKQTGKYVLYYRPQAALHAGWARVNRLTARVESNNLMEWDWDNARCVLDTDGRDGSAVPQRSRDIYKARGRDVQVERMTVLRHKDFFIGLAGIIDNIQEGRYETYLLHSYDGINWIREMDRTPFIGLSPFGHWDSGMAGSIPAGCPVEIGDKLIFYYMGSNMTHSYVMKQKQKYETRNIGAGYVKQGRFVGYHANKVRGELLTRPFLLTGKSLILNANASQGKIKVGIAYANGTSVKGYDKNDFIVVSGDELELPLKWKAKKDLTELLAKKIRLRIEVDNGAIYGFKIK